MGRQSLNDASKVIVLSWHHAGLILYSAQLTYWSFSSNSSSHHEHQTSKFLALTSFALSPAFSFHFIPGMMGASCEVPPTCGRGNWLVRQLTRLREICHGCSIVQRNCCTTVYLSFFFRSSIYCATNFLFITYSLLFNLSRHKHRHLFVRRFRHAPHHISALPRFFMPTAPLSTRSDGSWSFINLYLSFNLHNIFLTSRSIRHLVPWLVRFLIKGPIDWMVGSRVHIWVLSALAGGTSRVLQIESLNDEPFPELFPAWETPRRGLDNATSTSPVAQIPHQSWRSSIRHETDDPPSHIVHLSCCLVLSAQENARDKDFNC